MTATLELSTTAYDPTLQAPSRSVIEQMLEPGSLVYGHFDGSLDIPRQEGPATVSFAALQSAEAAPAAPTAPVEAELDPEVANLLLYSLKLRDPQAFAEKYNALGAAQGRFDAFENLEKQRIISAKPETAAFITKLATEADQVQRRERLNMLHFLIKQDQEENQRRSIWN